MAGKAIRRTMFGVMKKLKKFGLVLHGKTAGFFYENGKKGRFPILRIHNKRLKFPKLVLRERLG